MFLWRSAFFPLQRQRFISLFSLMSTSSKPPIQAALNYQKKTEGQRIGRYIDREDEGDLEDVHYPAKVDINDARLLSPSPSLEKIGFELRRCPTYVNDFLDDEEVKRVYYPEMNDLILKATGAQKVMIFDHTVRKSGISNLNTMGKSGVAAGSVARVHCDYTAESAPLRVSQLLQKESYTGTKIDDKEFGPLLDSRFVFINVWRNIVEEPIQTKPLAVCDPSSVDPQSYFLYELVFPDRVGQNYSLSYSPDHKWYYFPLMKKEECLMFKVYDKKEVGPRFVFHTSFDDPTTPPNAPIRCSIEIRSIAFF